MKDDHLKDLLNELHDELAKRNNLDNEGKQLLEDLSKDILQLLEKKEDQKESQKDLTTRLEDSIAHFEVTHPELVVTISKILEGLSNVGI
jgi:cell division septum initiation protein DivIVA